jgi:hypothetical protein
MMKFRFIPLAAALVATISLTACKTAPMMPMGNASASPGTAAPNSMAMMDAQMKTMQGMHDKMMAAKTPEERNKLMAEHMKTMQDSMKMMGDMKGMQGMQGMHDKMMAAKTPEERNKLMAEHMKTMQDSMKMMGDMKGMQGMTGGMGARHQMMEKRMDMMHSMMQMMMDQMPTAPVK